MAPVRNVLCYQHIAIQPPGYKQDKNDENRDFCHFSTKIFKILNGRADN